MYHNNGRYENGGANQQKSQDPNFKFCTFCKGDVTRSDNLRFTHWLFDKDTKQLTCPFLLNTVCQICLQTGHTTKACKNAGYLEALQFEAMSLNAFTPRAAYVRMEFEREIERRIMVKAYLDMEKHCTFCSKGDFKDEFYKTHTLNRCPRLACSTCTYCGEKGHTKTKCPNKANDDLWNSSDPNITDYVLDFDAAEAYERSCNNFGASGSRSNSMEF